MTSFDATLESIGLAAYIPRLREEGFDSWEALMDITEEDFDFLDVKRGHRRKLQRAIADAQGLRDKSPSNTDPRSHDKLQGDDAQGDANSTANPKLDPTKPQKRKYIRRPPKDPNAPKRPLPAYVIFANELRAVFPRNIEFKNFTKLVGRHWQALDPVEKEQRESAAQKLKDDYNKRYNEYKKTADHAKHQDILAAWKLKHPNGQGLSNGAKRLRTNSGLALSMRDTSMEGDDDYSMESNDEQSHSPPSPPWGSDSYASSNTSAMVSRWRSNGLEPAGGFPTHRQRTPFDDHDRHDSLDVRRPPSHHDDRPPAKSGLPGPGQVSKTGERDSGGRSYGRGPELFGSPGFRGVRPHVPLHTFPPVNREGDPQPSSTALEAGPPSDGYYSMAHKLPRYERHSSPRPSAMLPRPTALFRPSSFEDRARWAEPSLDRYQCPQPPLGPASRSSPPVTYVAPPQRIFESRRRPSPPPTDTPPMLSRTRNEQSDLLSTKRLSPTVSERSRPIGGGQNIREDTTEPEGRATRSNLSMLLRSDHRTTDGDDAAVHKQPQQLSERQQQQSPEQEPRST